MRIEELANNAFIKETDSVERYLLDIIEMYFKSNNIDTDSREYIINQAVKKMKEELDIDNAGVVSVNGQTGEVEITLDDLGGEPLVSPKLTAFNVNFGSEENTACMGNDPRLSDSRNPLPHSHDMSDINGLNGELSTIRNNIDLLAVKTHKHDNLEVLNKLVYSGKKAEIDLTILDGAEDDINEKISEADAVMADTKQKLEDLIRAITDELAFYRNDYDAIKTYIDDGDTALMNNIKEHCDNTLNTMKTEIDTVIDNKVSKDKLKPVIDELNLQYGVFYESLIPNFITSNDSTITHVVDLPDNIIQTLADKEFKVNFYIKYFDPNSSNEVILSLPFIHAEAGNILYTVKAELINKKTIKITSTKGTGAWAEFIDSAIIKIIIATRNHLIEV